MNIAVAFAAFFVPLAAGQTPSTFDNEILTDELCTEGYVECINGLSGGQTCEEACGGMCCAGPLFYGGGPCKGYTGRVCKDGKSCFGERACLNANINMIVEGCSGEMSCMVAGFRGGVVEKVIKSCWGKEACGAAAYVGGFVGTILNSCQQDGACWEAAACTLSNPNCGSNITEITSSCNGRGTCFDTASRGGAVDAIVNACNADGACSGAGKGEGNTIPSGIKNCCNAEDECDEECENTAGERLCETPTEATLPEACRSSLASPTLSTMPTTSPVSQESSSFGGIPKSCADCLQALTGIPSGIEDCCQTVCQSMNETILLNTCSKDEPTKSHAAPPSSAGYRNHSHLYFIKLIGATLLWMA